MEQNNWALREFNIDATKDIETFLKEVEADPYFHSFIEIMKKTQNGYFKSLLYDLIPGCEIDAGFVPIFSKVDTIFDLERAYDAFERLVYYLVDDECLTLAEIDYDLNYSFSLPSKILRVTDNRKFHVLCTGLWNTSRSSYDFFCGYLNKEIKNRHDGGVYHTYEISKVNKVRYHCFNDLDGVKDFTSFINFVYEKQQKMLEEYNKEEKECKESGMHPVHVKPSYFERCDNILSEYLDSTTTTEAIKDGCDEDIDSQGDK